MSDETPKPTPIRLASSTDTPGQAPHIEVDAEAGGPFTLRRIVRPRPTPVPPPGDDTT